MPMVARTLAQPTGTAALIRRAWMLLVAARRFREAARA